MTETQAPTPGPLDWTTWSGGPRPHPPATRVRVRYRDGTEDEGASAFCDWLHSPRRSDPKDVVAYKIVRKAHTAPVEASGSERALQDAVDFGVGFLVDGQRVSPERVTVCHGNNSPLRPQPSGETRELVEEWTAMARRATPPVGCLLRYVPISEGEISAIEALLSARPLAFGGQQGESDLCRVEKAITAQPGVKKCIAHGDINVRQIANAVLHVMGATPARAEAPSDDLRTACKAVLDDYQTSDAHHPDHVLIRRTDFVRIKALVEAPVAARDEDQDEGAAREWPKVTDQWAETYCGLTGQNPDGTQVSFIGDGAVTTTFRDMAKRQIEAMLCAAPKAAVRAISAHPSPTPAQDEGAAGWIVGNSEDSRWRSWDQGNPVWVDDRAKATRYARREDAEAVHAEDEDAWCVKPYPSPTPAADADRVRIAVGALEPFALLAPSEVSNGVNMADPLSKWFTVAQFERAASAIDALKSTAADADKVRIAVEALEKIAHGPWPKGLERAEDQVAFDEAVSKQALAALKSTAAKEGGA